MVRIRLSRASNDSPFILWMNWIQCLWQYTAMCSPVNIRSPRKTKSYTSHWRMREDISQTSTSAVTNFSINFLAPDTRFIYDSRTMPIPYQTPSQKSISAAMTGFPAANRSPLVVDALHRLLALHGFRTGIPHFATKAIFEMESDKPNFKLYHANCLDILSCG